MCVCVCMLRSLVCASTVSMLLLLSTKPNINIRVFVQMCGCVSGRKNFNIYCLASTRAGYVQNSTAVCIRVLFIVHSVEYTVSLFLRLSFVTLRLVPRLLSSFIFPSFSSANYALMHTHTHTYTCTLKPKERPFTFTIQISVSKWLTVVWRGSVWYIHTKYIFLSTYIHKFCFFFSSKSITWIWNFNHKAEWITFSRFLIVENTFSFWWK